MKINTAISKSRSVSSGPSISRNKVDTSIVYVGSRVSKAAIYKEIIGKSVPKLDQPGYLLVTGNKPGHLVRPVFFDKAQEVYKTPEGKYGSVAALEEAGLKGVLLTSKQLVQQAEKIGKCIDVTREFDEERLRVWLLNDFGDNYVAAIGKDKNKLVLFNMEHPAPHNRAYPKTRFKDPKHVDENFGKFFKGVS